MYRIPGLIVILFLMTGLYAEDARPSIVTVNLFGGLGGDSGAIMDAEHEQYNLPRPASLPSGNAWDGRPWDYEYHAGIFCDLTVMNSSVSQNAFFTFGLRGVYSYYSFLQRIDGDHADDSTPIASGILMKYHSLGFGPVISFL